MMKFSNLINIFHSIEKRMPFKRSVPNNSVDICTLPTFKEIRLEMTNRCGCNCYMCPREQMTRSKGTMSMRNLNIMVSKLSYIDYPIQVHLHGYGESLLCQDLPERIKCVSRINNFLPFIITTLAYKLDDRWFKKLFDNGLKFMLVSFYGYNEQTYKIIHGSNGFSYVVDNLQQLAKIKDAYDIEVRVVLDDFGDYLPNGIDETIQLKQRKETKEWLRSIGFFEREIIQNSLHNFGNKIKDIPRIYRNDKCSIYYGARRDILQIDWEGNVIPCCFDMNSDYKWGNIFKQSLREIFASEERRNFLDKVMQGTYIPMCDGCKH